MPRQTSRDLRNESRLEVLHALFTLGPSTRQKIAKHTGLSTATVATLVTQFLAEGVLRIATVEQNTVGRPYERLTIDPDRGASSASTWPRRTSTRPCTTSPSARSARARVRRGGRGRSGR